MGSKQNTYWEYLIKNGKVEKYSGLHKYKSYFSAARLNADILCSLDTPEKIDFFMSHYGDTVVQAAQECNSRLMRRQDAKWEKPTYVLVFHPDHGHTLSSSYPEIEAHGEHPFTKRVSKNTWKAARKLGLQNNVSQDVTLRATVAFFDARCHTVLVPKRLTSYFNQWSGDLDGFIDRYVGCEVARVLPDGTLTNPICLKSEHVRLQKDWELALAVITGDQAPPLIWNWENLEEVAQDEIISLKCDSRITIDDFLDVIPVDNPNFKISWDPKDPKRRGSISYKEKPLIGSVSLTNAGMSGYFKTDDESLLSIFKEARNGEKGEIKIAMLDKQTFEELLVNLVLKIDSK